MVFSLCLLSIQKRGTYLNIIPNYNSMVKKKVDLKKGECVSILKKMPDKSVNMIFADPPYNLSGKNYITCINGRKVKCDKGVWDLIEDIDKFNYDWIKECMRVLKDDGTIWISGTLHNHPSVDR